tara:strand:+ start:489 stop:1523 length:1035 start_codon:yes stop_codon:yes gene_type:complete
MKKLYEFKITKVESVVKKDTVTNEKGEKVTTEKAVEDKVKHSFFLRKPTRALYDEAELFYGVELSKGIKAGLLTKALLAKRYENDGGSLSDGEIERYGNLYLDFYRRTDDYQRLLMSADEDLSDEDKEKLNSMEAQLQDQRSTLTQFEMEQQSLYEQTAEVRARNKTILWWILNISYNGEEHPYFPGTTFEEKLSKYDELSENDDVFTATVIQRLTYFVSFWFVGRASSQEEFDAMLAEQGLLEEEGEEAPEEPVEAPELAEEAPKEPEEAPAEPEGAPEEISKETVEKVTDIVLEKIEEGKTDAGESPAEEKPAKKRKKAAKKKKAPAEKSKNNPKNDEEAGA